MDLVIEVSIRRPMQYLHLVDLLLDLCLVACERPLAFAQERRAQKRSIRIVFNADSQWNFNVMAIFASVSLVLLSLVEETYLCVSNLKFALTSCILS